VKELVYHRLFLPAAERYAGRPAVHDGEHHASFGEHAARVLRLAHGLRHELGLERGDRVAVLAANSHRYMELYHALALGTGVAMPLNTRLADPELVDLLERGHPAVIFADAACEARATELLGRLGDGRRVRLVPLGAGGFDELVEGGEEEVPGEPEEEDAALVMFTGGTTGRARGVVLSQRAAMLNLYHLAMVGGIGFRPGSVFLHQAPMFHAMGMSGVLATGGFGVESVVVAVFDPALVLELVERYRVEEMVLVPSMIAMLLAHPEFRPERVASLRRIGYGGAPMPEQLQDTLRGLLPDLALFQGYGMTEAFAAATFLDDEDHRRGERQRRSVGRALPGVELRIEAPDGSQLGPGEVGEVCLRGGNLMDGYLDDEAATKEAFRGGSYHTGDAGYLDEEGYLHLVDRVKDMIVTGGENVYSLEVEQAIATHPGVAQVAVIGVPHPVWGEAVHAIVVPRPGAAPTEEEIKAHVRSQLAGYKVPKTVELRSEPLPLSGAMKPLKRELRNAYWRS
jgi:long-chain acyl-CoA synthetase